MRQFTGRVPAVMILILSLVSMMPITASATELIGNPLPTVTRPKTATRSVQGHVKVPKFKVLRSNPFRKSYIIEGLDTDVDDDNIAPGYRRRDLTKLQPSDELSDYVTVRLAVARAKAMEAYRNKWQS